MYCSYQTNPSRWVLAMCSSIEAGRNCWLRESGVVFINRIVFLTFEILVIISLSRDFTSNDFRTNVCSISVINHRFRSLPNVMYIYIHILCDILLIRRLVVQVKIFMNIEWNVLYLHIAAKVNMTTNNNPVKVEENIWKNDLHF